MYLLVPSFHTFFVVILMENYYHTFYWMCKYFFVSSKARFITSEFPDERVRKDLKFGDYQPRIKFKNLIFRYR